MNRVAGRLILLVVAFSLSLCTRATWAQGGQIVPLSAFVQQVSAAQQLVAACSGNAGACDANGLPDRETVQGAAGQSFTASWQWLRDGMADARKAKPADRVSMMNAAQNHLTELASEASAAQAIPGAEFSKARAAANTALARGEFRADEGPTWTERQLARLQDWILKLFTGMDKVGRRAPWLAPLIEWGCFALAAAGLLWFVRQSLARQALRIALSEGVPLVHDGDRNSADWARLAEERAAAGDWREALHCQYWAAIALMETRRAWRPNATRTPREYVRLLKPGSDAQRALRELTRTFERVWYGHAEADEQQFRASQASLRALETARPERATSENAPAGPVIVAGGA